MASKKTKSRKGAANGAVDESTHAALVAENAALKAALAESAKRASDASLKQAAAPGEWDKAARPHALHRFDRIRQVHADQLRAALESGRDMERGLRSTAIEILNRIRRLEDHKLTPNEAMLKPLLLAAEANHWRPAPHKGHKLREIQPSKRRP